MFCNSFGEIMKKQWFWLAEQYSYIKLHAFIVMPNHIHGIVEICAGTVGTGRDPSVNFKGDPSVFSDLADKSRLVPTKVKPLSQIIGAYKTTTSKQIHLEGFTDFKWQRSFYDHIIRDSKSYTMISEYIKENPLRWKEDKFYKTRLIHEWKAHEWGNNFW